MDRARLYAIIDDVFNNVARLEAISQERGRIAIVMSRDMRYEIIRNMNTEYTTTNGGVETLFGYRIGVINEQVEGEYIVPALIGMNYHDGMQINDVIIVDDDNRLYRLESTSPIRFTDMGLTVNFGEYVAATAAEGHYDVAMDTVATMADTVATAANTATITLNDAVNTATITLNDFASAYSNIRWDDIGYMTAQATTNIGDGSTQWFRVPYDYYYGTVEQTFAEPKRPKRKAKREEELSAGDTRLMDEFLEGFRKNGA